MLDDATGSAPPLIASQEMARLEDDALQRRKCFSGDSLLLLLRTQENFPWTVERTARGDKRPGYTALRTGAFVDFDITGSRAASIAYLQSYTNVGTTTLSCGLAIIGEPVSEKLKPGCSCGVTHKDALMSGTNVSIPVMRDIRVHTQHKLMNKRDRSASCVLRVRAMGESRHQNHNVVEYR